MHQPQFHESVQRGSPDFPLEYYLLDQGHPRYEMSFHWHAEVELLRVISGRFTLSVEDETLCLGPGDTAFIASGCLHGGTPENAVYECVVLDMRFLLMAGEACRRYVGAVLHREIAVNSFFPAQSEAARAVEPLFLALREEAPGREAVAAGCLLRLIGEIYRLGLYHAAPTPEDYRRTLQLKRVFELIEQEYASPLSLARLAACANMNPRYFCRFFKQAAHRSPMDYLNYYRVERACCALAASDCNVTEAALDAGFSDTGYFIRIFKRYKGVTPGKYAARVRGRG